MTSNCLSGGIDTDFLRTFCAPSGEIYGTIEKLYIKYMDELEELSIQLAKMLRDGLYVGNTGTFDLEGELYYIIIREIQAKNILEIGCGSGWSTLYLAAAAEKNGNARITSFELSPDYVANFRKNVMSRYPFVKICEGDCVEEFLKHNLKGPFEFVLMDAHRRDLPQFAFSHIFPKVKGVIAIDDVVPDSGPWHSRETVFYLWFLLRARHGFLPIASLLDHQRISAVRQKLPLRSNIYKTKEGLAKGIVLYMDGAQIPEMLLDATHLRYDEFPPEGLSGQEIASVLQFTPPNELPLAAMLKSLWCHAVVRPTRRGLGRFLPSALKQILKGSRTEANDCSVPHVK